MKMFKDYWCSVCVAYTVLAIVKVLTEALIGMKDPFYQKNLGMMFGIICFATFVLFMHRIFHKIPMLIVMIGQYIVIMGGIWLEIWITGKFIEVSDKAYIELFWQVTLPYVVFAGIYYKSYFNEVKMANNNLSRLKEKMLN